MSGKLKHGRSKRFTVSCVFKDTAFHDSACDYPTVGLNISELLSLPVVAPSKYNPKQLFRRLPLPLRVTAMNSPNLSVKVHWQHMARLCNHCVAQRCTMDPLNSTGVLCTVRRAVVELPLLQY